MCIVHPASCFEPFFDCLNSPPCFTLPRLLTEDQRMNESVSVFYICLCVFVFVFVLSLSSLPVLCWSSSSYLLQLQFIFYHRQLINTWIFVFALDLSVSDYKCYSHSAQLLISFSQSSDQQPVTLDWYIFFKFRY